MIGDKRLEMPNHPIYPVDALKLLLYFGFQVDFEDNIYTQIRYASRLVEINNEVYDKLHHNEPSVFDISKKMLER